MSEFRGFVFPAQFGGGAFQDGLVEEYRFFRKVVEPRLRLTRGVGIESVHMAFLVDGCFATYGCAKAERLKLMRKRQEAWVDLGVPISAYEGRTREEIRLYLCECVEAGLDLLVTRFRKEGICDGCELLYGDWQAAKAAFLAG